MLLILSRTNDSYLKPVEHELMPLHLHQASPIATNIERNLRKDNMINIRVPQDDSQAHDTIALRPISTRTTSISLVLFKNQICFPTCNAHEKKLTTC